MVPFKSVRVGPFDVEICSLEGKEKDNNLGIFCDTQLRIALRDQYNNRQQEAETLLHELMHAIYGIMGIKSKDGEERIIHQMSLGMAMVMRDNPDLMRWFQEQLK